MKKKSQQSEDMFLGVDGFCEIESITPQAKQAQPEKADPPVKSKQNNTKHISAKEIILAMTDGAHDATRRLKAVAHKAAAKLRPTRPDKAEQFPHSQKSGRGVYKKRAVLAVAACVTAVMLSLTTVVGAAGSDNSADKQETAATQQPTVQETTLPAFKPAIVGNTASDTGISALYIDGKLIGATTDGEGLQAALDKLLLDSRAGYDDTTTTEFVNGVEIKPYTGDESALTSAEAVMAAAEGKFSIALSTDWIFESETEYETEVNFDDSLPTGYEEVTQEGQNGLSELTIRLTYTDGVQTDAVITESKTIIEPINKQVTVGCSDGVSDSYYADYSESHTGGSGVSTGGFIWPLPHTHSVTSLMEWRWGRMHNGIDIAGGGDYGMPIVAADGGTVIWSGNDGGGYGNYVMIDHGNGYTTVYGHASELACSTGDYVSQGETIAYVGSTGNSTGPHLHFEIRLNGEYLDPLGFVS